MPDGFIQYDQRLPVEKEQAAYGKRPYDYPSKEFAQYYGQFHAVEQFSHQFGSK